MAINKINYTRIFKKRILLEKNTPNKKFVTNYKDIKKYFKYLNNILFKRLKPFHAMNIIIRVQACKWICGFVATLIRHLMRVVTGHSGDMTINKQISIETKGVTDGTGVFVY